MLRHASAEASSAFIASRFDPEWGPVAGISSGSRDPAVLIAGVWACADRALDRCQAC